MSAPTAPSSSRTPRFAPDCPLCRGAGWRRQRLLPAILIVLALGLFVLSALAARKLLAGEVPGGDPRAFLPNSQRYLAAPLAGVACLIGSWQSRRVRCRCADDND